MTIAAATPSYIQIPGNGTAISFAFPFKIFQATDLIVGFITSGGYVLQSSGFIVQNVDINGGGNLVFSTAPPIGTTVDIRTDTPLTQTTEFANLGQFLPEAHTEAFDRLTRELQDLYRQTYTFGLHAPDMESAPWASLPLAAARAGSFLAFDTAGQPTTAVPVSGSITQQIIGTLLFPQTPAEISAGVTPVNYAYQESVLYRYGTNTTPGTTDMTSALQKAALVAALSGKILIPHEDQIKTTAATTLPSGCAVSGGGFLTNLMATTTNQVAVFVTSAASNVTIRNLLFTGSNTSSATANGNAVQINDSDHVKIDGCQFTLFRGPPVMLQGDSSTHNDVIVQNCYFFGNQSTSTAGEVNIYGTYNGIQVVGCRFEASATAPFGRGVFIADLSSSLNWTDLTVDRCFFNGYANNAIGTDDENPSGTVFRCGKVKITNCTILNIVQEGIKLKNTYRCIVTNNYLENCDTVPEIPGNLQGTIFLNGAWDTTCSDNIIINAGTDGIRATGENVGSPTTGSARSAMNINNNIVENAGGSGIFTTNDLYESNILGNSVRNSTGNGITIAPGSGNPGRSMIVANNNVRGTSGNSSGINCDSVTSSVTLNANQVKLCGGYGMLISNCSDVVAEGNIVMDNGVGGVNNSGIKFSTITNLVINSNRAGNNVSTTQAYGLEFAGTITNWVLGSNNFSGNQTASTLNVTLPTTPSATALTLQNKVSFISGTTNITSISADGWVGQTVTLIFTGILTVTDGSNLKLAGNFVTTADDTLTLVCEGSNFWEVARSVN